jgi:hypothetical protein
MWLESTGFGTFVRESTSVFGYPTFIVMHTIGLSIVVGSSTVIGARVLGFAETIPLGPLGKLFPLMWVGFGVNTFSGSGLAAATATGQFTNPIFLTKLALVIGGVTCMFLLQTRIFRNREITESGNVPTFGKLLAGGMLGFWLLAMIGGRLIAYAGVILP